MKINGLTDTNRIDALREPPPKASAKTPAAGTTTTTTATAGPADAKATALQAAPRAAPGPMSILVSDVPPFDSTKVERIKDAIRNGQFHVDSTTVAHKLLTSVNELFGRAH